MDKEIYTNEADMYQIEHMIRDNVDVMLTTSLMQVMNNLKLILLFDTENYKTYEDGEEFTYSPWIYHEICCAKYIDTNNQIFKPSIRHFSINESIKFKYSIEYVFDSIRLSDLFNWFNEIHSMQIDILSKKSIKLLYDTYEYSNYMGEK